MSGYSDGRRVEWAVVDYLQENGYQTVRAASSKGFSDVVAVKLGQCLIVNCKRTTMPGPDERQRVLRVAGWLGDVGVPLVALKPLRKPLEFRLLTGPGPKEWTPWSPDELAEVTVLSTADAALEASIARHPAGGGS